MADGLPCTDAPALFNCGYTSFETTDPYTSKIAGGYTTDGWLTSGNVYNNDLSVNANQGINSVTNLTANVWMYNVPQDNCGTFGLGPGAVWLNALGNGTNAAMLVELGPVADQSFVGGSFAGFSTSFYAGKGDYSTLFDTTGNYTVQQNATEKGHFDIAGLWFGQSTSSGGDYFAEIGYSESSTRSTFALNFQGLGLPFYEWNELISFLYRINAAIADDLTCMSDVADGICSLSKSCTDASYTDLWSYFIKVQW
jgi:hypothetical protein